MLAGEADEECEGSERETGTGGLFPGSQDHDASPKPATRLKEKRMNRYPGLAAQTKDYCFMFLN